MGGGEGVEMDERDEAGQDEAEADDPAEGGVAADATPVEDQPGGEGLADDEGGEEDED